MLYYFQDGGPLRAYIREKTLPLRIFIYPENETGVEYQPVPMCITGGEINLRNVNPCPAEPGHTLSVYSVDTDQVAFEEDN